MSGVAETAAAGRPAASLGLLGTVLMWGTMVPFTATLLGLIDPFLLSPLRYAIGLPALLLLCLVLDGRLPVRRAMPWQRIALLGSVGMAGFSTFFTLGVLNSDPVMAAVVMTSGPVVAVVMARLMYGTALARGLGMAIALAVGGGVLVAVGAPRAVGGFGFRGGEVLLVLSMVCWSWYSMKAQEWLAPLGFGQLGITTLTTGAGLLALLVLFVAVAAAGAAGLPVRTPSAAEAAMLVVTGAGAAGVAIALWNFGASRLGVPVASLYLNLVPVVAVALAAALGAPLTLLQVVGGGLVLAGVVQLQLRRSAA